MTNQQVFDAMKNGASAMAACLADMVRDDGNPSYPKGVEWIVDVDGQQYSIITDLDDTWLQEPEAEAVRFQP